MTVIVCAQCSTISTQLRGEIPWCHPCGIYLIFDEQPGEWISYAERHRRQQSANNRELIARSARLVDAHVLDVRRLLPAGWNARPHQSMDNACHTIGIDPPADTVDASAYLSPPQSGRTWYVRIHHRAQQVDFPLYSAGGAHAACFDNLEDAVTAAVTALRLQLDS